MTYIVLPQAVRNVLPDLLSNTLEVVKLTSLGSVVAMPELLFQARQAQSVTYNATPIVMAAVIYFLMLWPLVRLLEPAREPRARGVEAETRAIAWAAARCGTACAARGIPGAAPLPSAA